MKAADRGARIKAVKILAEKGRENILSKLTEGLNDTDKVYRVTCAWYILQQSK